MFNDLLISILQTLDKFTMERWKICKLYHKTENISIHNHELCSELILICSFKIKLNIYKNKRQTKNQD